MVSANRIEAILAPGSANAKRLVKAAKADQYYLDLTSGRTTKALILLENGKLIGCALTPRTIAVRIQMNESEENSEGDDNHESYQSVGETVAS